MWESARPCAIANITALRGGKDLGLKTTRNRLFASSETSPTRAALNRSTWRSAAPMRSFGITTNVRWANARYRVAWYRARFQFLSLPSKHQMRQSGEGDFGPWLYSPSGVDLTNFASTMHESQYRVVSRERPTSAASCSADFGCRARRATAIRQQVSCCRSLVRVFVGRRAEGTDTIMRSTRPCMPSTSSITNVRRPGDPIHSSLSTMAESNAAISCASVSNMRAVWMDAYRPL